jgi:hypothetical protein
LSEPEPGSFENQVAEEMKKLGFSVERHKYFRTNWRADLIGKADDGSMIVIEVKTNMVGIPDVLAVASTASSGSRIGEPMSGAIVSSAPTPLSIARIAGQNDVTVLTVDESSKLQSRLAFLGLIARIESRLRKIAGMQSDTKLAEVIDKLSSTGALPADLITNVKRLSELRNLLAHDVGEKDIFEDKWIEFASSALGRLEYFVKAS